MGSEADAGEVARALAAIWRVEAPRVIAAATRVLRDLDRAEEVAQDTFVAALEQWPRDGVPANPGAWLVTTVQRRAVDAVRRAGLGCAARCLMPGLIFRHGASPSTSPLRICPRKEGVMICRLHSAFWRHPAKFRLNHWKKWNAWASWRCPGNCAVSMVR